MSEECAALCLYARKGGIGRTLLTQQLAGAFAERIRVLAIDQDPQGSLSKNFFGVSEVERLRAHQTVAAIYQGEYKAEEIIRPTKIENISLAPANDCLEPFDLPRERAEPKLVFALREFVSRVNTQFDVILIDTPPNVSNLLGWGSLAASDYVLTPIIPAKNAVEAVFDVKKRLQMSISQDNPALVDLGYFLTNFDRRLKIHHVQHQLLQQLHGEQVFDTIVYHRTGFVEAPFGLQPVTHRDPKSEEAELIRALLREVVQRINQRVHTMTAIDEEKENGQARQANLTTG